MNAVRLLTLLVVAWFVFALETNGMSGQTIPIGDFNDGSDDGWTHVVTGVGEAWGPGIFDATSGAYHLETTGLVPVEGLGVLTSFWDASADPIYTDGFLRAKVLTEAGGTNAGFLLRGDPQTGSAYYVVTTISGGINIFQCNEGRNSNDFLGCERLGGTNGRFGPGEPWMFEAAADGAIIHAKMWQVGERPPEQPQLIVQDFSFPTGEFGVTAFIGSNWTEPAKVSAFFDDICFRTSRPDALAGDFDGNGMLTEADIDMLTTEIFENTNDCKFDLSNDAMVDHTDLDTWLSDAARHNGFDQAYLVGDSNLDGAVNSTDLNSLALSWRQDVTLWSAGDFTADGVVNAADLNKLALNWRESILSAASQTAAVPEPAAAALAIFALATVTCLRRRTLGSCPRWRTRQSGALRRDDVFDVT